MKKAGLYRKDWFAALLAGIIIAAAAYARNPLLERFEYLAYDAGVRMTHRTAGAAEDIAIVAIDGPSVESIGRWPWPRTVLAQMLQFLTKAGAKETAVLDFLTEPQNDPGLAQVEKLAERVRGITWPKNAQRQAAELGKLLGQARQELDADGHLVAALAATRNLYLPMRFHAGAPLAPLKTPLPDFIRRNRITRLLTRPDNPAHLPLANGVRFPLERFGQQAAGIGHLNLFEDPAGGIRSEALLVDYHGELYPSIALLLAARSLNLGARDIEVDMSQGVQLGKHYVRTDAAMRLFGGFHSPRNGETVFATYSFHEVLQGRVPPGSFKDKVVLIGPTADGLASTYVTPASADMRTPELVANVITSILNQDFYSRPEWARWAELGLFGATLLYLMTVLPYMGAKIAALVSFVLLATLLGGGHYLMVSEKVWVRTVSPALLLLFGHLLLTVKRFVLTERLKAEAETDSAHNNRMLGLAFQGQGQLDAALDKFRRLSVDNSVLELFYNLALDFERKRQFNKAVVCYDYILGHESRFRDAAERRKRVQQAEHTVLLGTKAVGAAGPLMLDGVDHKPTLGRYEVERELGKGAMGAVYLGRDPKINRVVAIKTLALSEEFEGSDLEQVKERFFREAETAGRLNHPNIVTIYDAGEEHDLAYIAMEYLEGKDLTHYIQARKPPPLPWTVDVVTQVADALDYAHRNGVVHRDIKPANIMYNEANKSVKVTDFGIARITAASRTKTGVVLGTPSYMSPEQLAGKRVDGRSDLFSLGVTLFELLTGRQPFTGDSLAALMYQIANVKHPDVTEIRPVIPPCIRTILDKILHKNPGKRYQTGAEFRQALQKCMSAQTARDT